VQGWLRRPLGSDALMEGLQAIDWSVEERGLAGLSDMEGLPWTMPMDQFFEAWVETFASSSSCRHWKEKPNSWAILHSESPA